MFWHETLGRARNLNVFVNVVFEHSEVHPILLVQSLHHLLRHLGEESLLKLLVILRRLGGVLLGQKTFGQVSLGEEEVSVVFEGLHLDDDVEVEVAGRAQHGDRLPVLVVLVQGSLDQILHKLHEGGLLSVEQGVVGEPAFDKNVLYFYEACTLCCTVLCCVVLYLCLYLCLCAATMSCPYMA